MDTLSDVSISLYKTESLGPTINSRLDFRTNSGVFTVKYTQREWLENKSKRYKMFPWIFGYGHMNRIGRLLVNECYNIELQLDLIFRNKLYAYVSRSLSWFALWTKVKKKYQSNGWLCVLYVCWKKKNTLFGYLCLVCLSHNKVKPLGPQTWNWTVESLSCNWFVLEVSFLFFEWVELVLALKCCRLRWPSNLNQFTRSRWETTTIATRH